MLAAPDGDGAYVGVIEPDGDGAYVSVIEPDANAHRIAAQSKDVSAHIVDDAPHSAIPEGGSSEDTEDLSFEEDPQADKEMIDIEAWLAPLRPSPSDLAADFSGTRTHRQYNAGGAVEDRIGPRMHQETEEGRRRPGPTKV